MEPNKMDNHKSSSLTDMLWKGSSQGNIADTSASAGHAAKAGKAARAAHAAAKEARRVKQDFLPDAGAAAAKAKSFQDRVKESQAKLAGKSNSALGAKGHSYFDQGVSGHANAAANESARAAKPEAAQARAKLDRVGRPDKAESTRRDAKAERSEKDISGERADHIEGEGKSAGRPESPRHGKAVSASADKPAGKKAAAETEGTANATAIDTGTIPVEKTLDHAPMDPSKAEALRGKLEEIGLEVSAEQLHDPTLLAQLLLLIDLPALTPDMLTTDPMGGMVAATGMNAEAAGPAAALVAPELDGLSKVGDAVGTAYSLAGMNAGADAATLNNTAKTAVAGLGMAQDAGSPDPSTLEAGAESALSADGIDWSEIPAAERKEIASLIRDALGRATGAPGSQVSPDNASSGATALGQAAANGSQARFAPIGFPEGDMRPGSTPAAGVPMADQDRLRVLQSSAFAPDGAARPAFALPHENSLEMEGPLTELGDNYATVSMGNDGQDGNSGQSMTDLAGRDPSKQGNHGSAAEGFAPKDAFSQKDAAGMPFQGAIDQVRASDSRTAAQAPREAAPPGPAPQQAEVLAQIARKMSALSAGGRISDHMAIQLEPEHLGKVRVSLDRGDGGLTARISVENESVRQMVDANIAGLRDSLESQGIKLQGLEVNVEQRNTSLFNPDGNNAQEFFHRRGQGGNASAAGTDPLIEADAEADTGRRLGYNTMEYIA